MANNSAAVAIAQPDANGVLWYAKRGTPLPTSLNEELHEDFKCVGFIGSDGVEMSDNFTEGDGVKAYGGVTVVKGISSMEPDVKVTILETGNPDALGFAYNEEDVAGVLNSITRDITKSVPDDCSVVMKFARGNGLAEMIVLDHMVFGMRDNVKRDDSTPDGIPVTWKAREVGGVKPKFGTAYLGLKVTAP
jgi:hypothetical protein